MSLNGCAVHGVHIKRLERESYRNHHVKQGPQRLTRRISAVFLKRRLAVFEGEWEISSVHSLRENSMQVCTRSMRFVI